MKLKILVTAGDGIGPEVTNEAVAILKDIAAQGGHEFAFTEKRIGGVAIVQDGTPLPEDTLDAALAADAVLLGAVGGNEFNSLPPDKRPEAGLLKIRAALGGFANLRPAFAFKELAVNQPAAAGDCGRRRYSVRARAAGRALLRPAARVEQGDRARRGTRCATRATKWRAWRGSRLSWPHKRRKKLTSVDKANVLEVSQLWRATVNEVAKEFPGRDAGAPVRGRDGDAPDEPAARLSTWC